MATKKSTRTYCYVESVAVGDLVVDDGLQVDRLELELDGDINKPEQQDNGAIRHS